VVDDQSFVLAVFCLALEIQGGCLGAESHLNTQQITFFLKSHPNSLIQLYAINAMETNQVEKNGILIMIII
jgi:hypothetical protein